MANLAVALSRRGYKVVYVAQHSMSAERAALGWLPPLLTGVTLQLAETDDVARKMAQDAPTESVHICQGVRANGMIRVVQAALREKNQQQWVVMETVNDSGWSGIFRRIEYRRIFQLRRRSLQGVLAIGHRTADWVTARGFPSSQVFQFSYFLPVPKEANFTEVSQLGRHRFLFVGRLDYKKRIDWLISALGNLKDKSFELWIVGAGPKEVELRLLASKKLDGQVHWLGQMPLPDVPAVMAQVDCLVLPSVHDGWGAVASEALMVGTPVICSDSCGVAGVVRNSGCGGVFVAHDFNEFTELISLQMERGRVDSALRKKIKDWAVCLGSDAGAAYLHEILMFTKNKKNIRPEVPWDNPGVIK